MSTDRTRNERRKRWNDKGTTKRKVADFPTELAAELEAAFKKDGANYQAWAISQAQSYLRQRGGKEHAKN